jgi:predicted RNA-binding Zn-ribbon protein involved in translation (DUF1610 family)
MDDQFPPVGYIQVASSIDGIEIYKLAPPSDENRSEIVSFNCPQCGATTAYSAKDGGLKCVHCGYYESPHEMKVGIRAESREFTVETMKQVSKGWGVPRKELECQNCGSVTTLPVQMLAHTCAFCGSNKVIQRDAYQDLLRPKYLIPFKIDIQQCPGITNRWLGSSWMTPPQLGKIGDIQSFVSIFLPFWTFDSKTEAMWKAEVGQIKTEGYYDPDSKKHKTRTVTEWRWESGHASLNFENLLVVGTNLLSKVLIDQMKVYQLAELVAYEPKYLAGFQARANDVPLNIAWEQARSEMREQTRSVCLGQASTSQVRNFSMTLDFRDEGWSYLLLPAYIAAYSYQGKIYQLLINGQTGVIAGQRPVDWVKVWAVIIALVTPGILFGLLGLLTVAFGGVGLVIGGIGFFLLVIGIVIAISIGVQAQRMDDA